MLDFVELKGETAKQLAAEILAVIEYFTLQDKVVAFSADNTNTNFGGLNRKGRVNVHTKAKDCLQREVIGLGCPAHIIHNTTRTALGIIPIDVELFKDPNKELWLSFALGNLSIFKDAIKKLEGQDRCAVELAAILKDLEAKLTARHHDDFIPVLARGLLRELEENCY
ncbi:uncharacterized protein LOC128438617 isoform X2 [Xyrichtys novacula]|uniref:Uncharacterized protein LOC128438617 isoform X2 n=1 Tax=Xyrichtys novacula TaxID=13765 RepID=A0AAV1FXI6_XYRNO|nr:uncharacterized protein LOC128438617 isoform X2 [Xyrichtys novacula]